MEFLGLKWQAAYHLDLQMVTMLRPRRADAGHSLRPWDRVWHAYCLSKPHVMVVFYGCPKGQPPVMQP